MRVHAAISHAWRTAQTNRATLPIAASLLVHGGLLAALVSVSIGPPTRPDRLTDAPGQAPNETISAEVTTVLDLSPPAPTPDAPPAPTVASEPPNAPEPVRVVPKDVITDTAPAAPARQVPARVASPAAAPTVVSAPTRAPTAAPAPAPQAPPPPTSVSFAGVQAPRAARVVYVVDASGPMTGSLPFVKAELARSIARLDSSQSFQVVVVRQPPASSATASSASLPASLSSEVQTLGGGESLVPADGEQKSRLGAWLANIEPGGGSDLRPGLRAAFAMKPDLVFLLSRRIRRTGDPATIRAAFSATLGELEALNAKDVRTGQRPTIVKALQFIDDDPTGLMPAIARQHGDGPDAYRVVQSSEIR